MESEEDRVDEILKALFPYTGQAQIIGVTGSPGSGKSTLVEGLARQYTSLAKKVGIIAVDPTSPFSGGAILGDRIRMQSLSTDPDVFIRSMATRGQLGGLSVAVNDAILVLDAAGYDVLIVETVGAGQDEVDVAKAAHVTILVLVPGMGDDIQALKAGIMEIGDIYVINKADRDGVQAIEQALQAQLSMGSRTDGWVPPLIQTIAVRGEGIEELAEEIERCATFLSDPKRENELKRRSSRDRLLGILRRRLTRRILDQISEDALNHYAGKMMTRELDPYTIVDCLLSQAGLGTGST